MRSKVGVFVFVVLAAAFVDVSTGPTMVEHGVRARESQAAVTATTTTTTVLTVGPAPTPPPPLPPAVPSPWARFDGAVDGPTATVAHVRGAVPIAASVGGAIVTHLSDRTRVGAPRVLLVVAQAGDWLQVLLPVRPNHSAGWVRRDDVTLTTVSIRLEIDRSARRLRVFDAGSLVIDEPVAVGRTATPTPAGQFYVTELLRPPNPGGPYGPYAFTLSAFSNVYQRFGSGDGAVGLHGTNAPRALGADVSHGCVRVANHVVERLAGMLPLGTPVLIR